MAARMAAFLTWKCYLRESMQCPAQTIMRPWSPNLSEDRGVMDFQPWMIVVPLVAVASLFWWKVRGGRVHRDAMVGFERFIRAQVDEPVEMLVAVQPGGSVGEQARAEWKDAARTTLARGLTGEGVRLSGGPQEIPPMAALALGAKELHLVPWRFAADGVSYILDGAPVAFPRAGLKARSRPGVLTIQLTIESAGRLLDLEVVRDPNGNAAAFVERICNFHPGDRRHDRPPAQAQRGPTGRKASTSSERTQRMARDLADKIERELREQGIWTDAPPEEAEVLAGGAFGMQSVPFVRWIQVVLVTRLREVAAGHLELPGGSSLSAFAAREFDGNPELDKLRDLLDQVDQLR